MSTTINNFGVLNYYDHHKEYNIDARGKDLASVLRACEAQDIQAEEVTPEPAKQQGTDLPFLNLKKLEELGTYSIWEFEAKYRKAASGDAKNFAAFLKKYQELQVFDFGERDKKQVFECLKEFFSDEIKYGYPNFAYYF